MKDSKLIKLGLLKTPMASQQHPTTMENLPDELLLNIFIRLLAKQLAQMRSVSKSWNALLSQSSFVKSHLDRSILNNDQVLLVFNRKVCSCDSKPFTAHPAQSPHLEFPNFNKLPPLDPHTIPSPSPFENNFPVLPSHPGKIIKVIGAVNGLICSCYGDNIIHIWNPSLSALTTLPPYHIRSACSPSAFKFRFGFDPKTADYKVVKISGIPIMHPHFPIYTFKEWLQVEVYSMKMGSWEVITASFPSHITLIYDEDHICVDGRDGRIHWLGFCSRGKTCLEMIVAFDLGSHIFSEMSLPDSILDHQPRFDVIGVLAGKLCVISQGENDAYEVWVMDEYGVAESWVKKHVFSLFPRKTSLFGFTSGNEFLLFDDDNDGRLVFYDPIANKTKIFEKFCCRDRGHPYKVVEYVDSLVWSAPAEREMVDGSIQN